VKPTTPTMPPTMLYEKRERVAIITINRPEAMNAFTAEMLRAMDAAFADFNADPGLWVAILTAAGEKSFSAFRRELFRKDWVVYAKPPFGGPEHVLHYLARYTHRIAISNHRLIVSVRPTASFQAAYAFAPVGVWTNNDDDQGGGEAVKKPNSWHSNVKRAALANGNSASGAECR